MSTQIGDLNAPKKIEFEKFGVTLTVKFEITPACRIKHAHLFKDMKDDDEKETSSRLSF